MKFFKLHVSQFLLILAVTGGCRSATETTELPSPPDAVLHAGERQYQIWRLEPPFCATIRSYRLHIAALGLDGQVEWSAYFYARDPALLSALSEAERETLLGEGPLDTTFVPALERLGAAWLGSTPPPFMTSVPPPVTSGTRAGT